MDIYDNAAAVRAEAAASVAALPREELERKFLDGVFHLAIETEHREQLGRDISTLISRCRDSRDEHEQLRYLHAFLYSFDPNDYDRRLHELEARAGLVADVVI